MNEVGVLVGKGYEVCVPLVTWSPPLLSYFDFSTAHFKSRSCLYLHDCHCSSAFFTRAF